MHAEVSPAGERCQLSCHYCYQGGMRDAGNFGGDGYDFEAIKRTMEHYGVSNLTLFGGEPLLAPMSRLEELFAFGHERFGGSNIQTNGELITEEHIKLFKQYRVTVGTSLDGPDELNDVRWNGTLEATRAATATIEANIARLCREGIRTSVIVTLHRLNGTGANFDRLREWIKGLVEIGITSMRLHILEADTPMVRSKYLMSNEEYLAAFLDLMRFEHELGRSLFDIPTDLRRMLLGEDDDVTCIWAGCDSYATGEAGFSVTHPGGAPRPAPAGRSCAGKREAGWPLCSPDAGLVSVGLESGRLRLKRDTSLYPGRWTRSRVHDGHGRHQGHVEPDGRDDYEPVHPDRDGGGAPEPVGVGPVVAYPEDVGGRLGHLRAPLQAHRFKHSHLSQTRELMRRLSGFYVRCGVCPEG